MEHDSVFEWLTRKVIESRGLIVPDSHQAGTAAATHVRVFLPSPWVC
jgi:hypothetical protein